MLQKHYKLRIGIDETFTIILFIDCNSLQKVDSDHLIVDGSQFTFVGTDGILSIEEVSK